MNKAFIILVSTAVLANVCLAQVGGGSAAYQGGQTGRGMAENNERVKRMVRPEEAPPNTTTMFLDASVLMNVKADEYVAMFGISQEGTTLDEANRRMDAAIGTFSAELRQLGVRESEVFTDFVAQNKIYGFDVANDIAKERVTGFEVKKNVSVHYVEKAMLDRCIAAAARAGIYDLIKVNYIVKDVEKVHSRLMEEAAHVIRVKALSYKQLFGISFRQAPQMYADRYSSYYPAEMYDSYAAFESEDVSAGYDRQKYVIQSARKNRTFYFNALSAKEFDRVVNPVVLEPVVQFTLYLKLRYDIGEPKAARIGAGR